jgi:PAS domain S-box-containing protein
MSDNAKPTILNVDDDDANRYAVSRTLRQEGFEVIEAANGAEALRLVRANPDLVILDVNLPDIDGFEVCQRTKTDPATALIPVLMLSATYTDDQFRVIGLESGAEGYLTQPVESTVLLAYVKALLRARQAEAALREGEEHYRAFIAHSSEAIWRLELEEPISADLPEDKQIQLLYQHAYVAEANEAMARMHGFPSATDVVGTRLGQLLPLLSPHNAQYLRTLIRSGYRATEVESREMDQQANVKYFMNSFMGIVEDGSLVRAWGVKRDITERKQMEEALRESAEKYRNLVENINDVLFATDEKGVLTYISPPIKPISGYSPSEIIGRPFSEFIHQKDVPRLRQQFQKVMSGHIEPSEYRIVTKSGEIRWVRSSSRPILEGNRPLGLQGRLEDVTERKQVEEMKDNLIRDVSHELKTPLAKMQMSVEMLMEIMGSPNMGRQFKAATLSEIVLGNVQRLQRTVNSILDLSSLESGRVTYHKTKVQPEKLIGQAILDMRPLAEAKGLELVAELPEGLPQIEGDREKLFHVLTNLVDNAVKFSDQGKIVISAEEKAHEVEIAVSDSGCGILRENLGRVFERFCQENPSIPGAGIGLAICKTIVEAHGGKIWAESAGRGHGTTIRFTLPVEGKR